MPRVGIYGVVGVMVFSAALFYFTGSSGGVTLPNDEDSSTNEAAVSGGLSGTWECLPRLGSLKTSECAVGLHKDGSATHYGLDLASVPAAAAAYQLGSHVRVEGEVVPTAVLKTTYWHQYNMTGIIRVTSVTKL